MIYTLRGRNLGKNLGRNSPDPPAAIFHTPTSKIGTWNIWERESEVARETDTSFEFAPRQASIRGLSGRRGRSQAIGLVGHVVTRISGQRDPNRARWPSRVTADLLISSNDFDFNPSCPFVPPLQHAALCLQISSP